MAEGMQAKLIDQLDQAVSMAYWWQDESRQSVEKRLEVTDADDPRIVDDPEYRRVMDAVDLVRRAHAAVKELGDG